MLNNKKYSISPQSNLFKLLENVDNKYCGDCLSIGPRWASCTLGIFLCVRCAGIHRNMGVHISRIKSVDHDNWTVQQVSTMKEIGNSRGRAIYEATLEDNFNRPKTNSKLDEFIRSKYEFKRYLAKEKISPSVEIRKLKENPNDNSRVGGNLRFPLSRIDNTVNPESDMNDTTDIDDDFGDFVSASQQYLCQTSGSAKEPFTITSSWNSSTIVNDTTEISNSSALSDVDSEAFRNILMPSDYQSQEYALNRNNDSVPGQMNANDTVDVQSHQLINNSGITGDHILQPIIPLVQQFDIVTNNNNNNDDDDNDDDDDGDDNDDDFGNIASANKRSVSNCQTSGSATEPFIVSPLRNSSTIVNDTREKFNSSALSDVDREAYRTKSMHSDYQSREYPLNRNNDSVPGQMNDNDTVDVQLHHLTNISGITRYPIIQLVISILQLVISIIQSVIHILQLIICIVQLLQFDLLQFVYYILTNSHLPAISDSVENENLNIQHHEDNHTYNELQDHSFNESSENPDSDFIVAIPETQYEFAIAYEETGTDNYPDLLENIEMAQLFTMLLE